MAMRVGIISCNIHANFTNYGSALQSWALSRALERCGEEPVLVDYCPDRLLGKDILDPIANMWDADEESRRMCELSLPAIAVNAAKFERFFTERFERTSKMYVPADLDDAATDEGLGGFVCGSDTIFCPDEFGVDDGYWANYPSMRGRSVAYAPSFGDPHFTGEQLGKVATCAGNFRAIAPREDLMMDFLATNTTAPVRRVVDPTLLLEPQDYDPIVAGPQEEGEYLVLYSRRYNPAMEAYAEGLAARRGWKVVEVSLRAENASRHRMFYEAGVEEFLSLVRGARFLVTNSYHGMIFAWQFRVPFYVFTREQAGNKVSELLGLMGLGDRLVSGTRGGCASELDVDWAATRGRMAPWRERSWGFLREELRLLGEAAGVCR